MFLLAYIGEIRISWLFSNRTLCLILNPNLIGKSSTWWYCFDEICLDSIESIGVDVGGDKNYLEIPCNDFLQYYQNQLMKWHANLH